MKDNDSNLVIQINGKKREVIKIKKDKNEDDVMELIYKNDKLNLVLKDKKILKKIYVPNRIINIILK